MKHIKSLLVLGAGIALATLSGCASSPPRGGSSAPVIVEADAPPAVIVEDPGEAPDTSHVWVEGYWVQHNGRYVWIPGHWEQRPTEDAMWVPGYWSALGSGWDWTPGFWSNTTNPPTKSP